MTTIPSIIHIRQRNRFLFQTLKTVTIKAEGKLLHAQETIAGLRGC